MSAPHQDRPYRRTETDEFLDLIYADEQWLAAEFEEIIAAEFPTPAPIVPLWGVGHLEPLRPVLMGTAIAPLRADRHMAVRTWANAAPGPDAAVAARR